MSRAKREPRAFTVADIAARFEMASYWFGEKWCPAVWRTSTGYAIRILKSQTVTSTGQQLTYDSFDLDEDGVITAAPRGWAKEYKPGRVTDIADAVQQWAEPRHDAMRLNIGGGL